MKEWIIIVAIIVVAFAVVFFMTRNPASAQTSLGGLAGLFGGSGGKTAGSTLNGIPEHKLVDGGSGGVLNVGEIYT